MRRRTNARPEPRTAHLIGLNLTDDDLAQLDHLFAALHTRLIGNSRRQNKFPRHTRSTVAYQCFHAGMAHYLESKRNPRRNDSTPDEHSDRPKRNAKLVGIYLSDTDLRNLTKLDSIVDSQFFRFFPRHQRHPFRLNKPTTLAYHCFKRGLALLLFPNAP
jgi:hypothetical protein